MANKSRLLSPPLVILAQLIRSGESTLSCLKRSTGLSYRTLISGLEVLKAFGLVSEKRFGRIRLYALRNGEETSKIGIGELVDCAYNLSLLEKRLAASGSS